jgi:hypothetical protein
MEGLTFLNKSELLTIIELFLLSSKAFIKSRFKLYD